MAGLVDELGLVEKIDAMISQDLSQRQVSVGMAIQAMILIGLGFVQRAWSLTPDFFRGQPVVRRLGPGITAERRNDDALGRALDAIFAFGVEAFYCLLASGVARPLGRSGAGGHLDSTRFQVDGEYHSGDEPAAGVVPIRQGQRASRVDVHARPWLQKSRFVVATNDTEGAVRNDEQVLEAYRKDPQKVERGFRFLKDPLFMAATLSG